MARFVTDLVAAFERRSAQDAILGRLTFSYGELLASVYRYARVLDRYAHRGDGIALMCGNRFETIAVRVAAYVLGLRAVLIPSDWPAHRVAAILDEARVVVIVHDPVWPPPPAGICPIIRLDHLPSLSAGESATPLPVRARDDDVAQLIYTSGTTGEPKGVENSFALLALEADEWDQQVWPQLPGVRFVTLTRFIHGAGGLTLSMLRRGIPVEPIETADLDEMLAAIAGGGRVITYLYSSMLCRLLAHPSARDGVPGLASVVYGSAPMPPDRIADAIARCGPIFRQWYALNEVAPVARLTVADHVAGGRLLASVGKPIPQVEVTIRDDDDRILASGAIGEVCVRAAHVTSGYWQRPDMTARAIRDGVLHTGDLGYLDAQGYLFLVERRSELIIVNGFNCYALPIEAVLASHPAINQVAVVGVPSEMTGEAVHAFVVCSDRTDIDDVRRYALARTCPVMRCPKCSTGSTPFRSRHETNWTRRHFASWPCVTRRERQLVRSISA